MSGYQTIEALRPMLSNGPPAMPLVSFDLVRAKDGRQAKSNRNTPPNSRTIFIMRSMRQARHPLSAIADATGFSIPTVRRHTMDIKPPPEGWSTGARKSGFAERKEFALRLHRSGFTFAEIGAELGCSESWAHRIVRGMRTRDHGPRTTTYRVVSAVSAVTGISCTALRKGWGEKGGKQRADVARARSIVFWILRQRHGATFPSIGRSLGGFDHSTVSHGVEQIERLLIGHALKPHRHDGRVASQIWRIGRTGAAL